MGNDVLTVGREETDGHRRRQTVSVCLCSMVRFSESGVEEVGREGGGRGRQRERGAEVGRERGVEGGEPEYTQCFVVQQPKSLRRLSLPLLTLCENQRQNTALLQLAADVHC